MQMRSSEELQRAHDVLDALLTELPFSVSHRDSQIRRSLVSDRDVLAWAMGKDDIRVATMQPIKTRESNFVYRGPTSEIADLPCRVEASDTFSVWEPNEEERVLIARGGNIRLGIHGMRPIPPVSLAVVPAVGPTTPLPDPCAVCAQEVGHPVHGQGEGTHAFKALLK